MRSEGSVTIVCCGTQMIDKDTPSFLYVSSLQQQPAVSECAVRIAGSSMSWLNRPSGRVLHRAAACPAAAPLG
jgi:hypothetical protein